MKTVTFAELPDLVGQEVGTSDWFEITQEKVNQFADATGDHQWIHVDVERASKELPTKSTIAHGFMTLSLIPMLGAQIMRIEGVKQGINYGCDKVRFTSMVPVGSKVRARQKIMEVGEKAGGTMVKSEFTIEIEGADRPACVAESIIISFPE
jgi:acyl dehydratase